MNKLHDYDYMLPLDAYPRVPRFHRTGPDPRVRRSRGKSERSSVLNKMFVSNNQTIMWGRLPDLSRLAPDSSRSRSANRQRSRRSQRHVDPEAGVHALADALDLLTTLREYVWLTHPQEHCDEKRTPLEEESGLRSTSNLWEQREINATSVMKEWNHLDVTLDISDFFLRASESNVDTIVHVVLARVQYNEES
eukprot:4269404-Prymnesium_polylepis.1